MAWKCLTFAHRGDSARHTILYYHHLISYTQTQCAHSNALDEWQNRMKEFFLLIRFNKRPKEIQTMRATEKHIIVAPNVVEQRDGEKGRQRVPRPEVMAIKANKTNGALVQCDAANDLLIIIIKYTTSASHSCNCANLQCSFSSSDSTPCSHSLTLPHTHTFCSSPNNMNDYPAHSSHQKAIVLNGLIVLFPFILLNSININYGAHELQRPSDANR